MTATVLIVDDDQAVADTFARLLELEGYRVKTAPSAEIGLSEAAANRPDAIILDFRMPITNGLGFLRQLRAFADQRDTPVAIVTGDYFLEDHVEHELAELGARIRYKPLWVEDMVCLTRALLNGTN